VITFTGSNVRLSSCNTKDGADLLDDYCEGFLLVNPCNATKVWTSFVEINTVQPLENQQRICIMKKTDKP